MENIKDKYKKLNKLIKILLLVVLIIGIISIILLYMLNINFREGFDKYILRKEIFQEETIQINLTQENSKYIYAYDKYITILSKNILEVYSNNNKPVYELPVFISEPLFYSNNRFLAMAEHNGGKLYLISGQNIVWQKDIEGQISKISVNKNGYISVIVSASGYKTIVITYNPEGKELFKTYLSTTYALSVDISNDNKYLAIAEANTYGTQVQCNVKIISLEKAQTSPSEAVVYIYNSNLNEIITNLKYQEKNNLIYSMDGSINSIKDNNNEMIYAFDNNTLFADINLNNSFVKIKKYSSGLLQSNYRTEIVNLNTKKENIYTLKDLPKSVYAYEDMIAINLGTELHIINTSGWLVKKYIAGKEIKDIVMCNNIIGVIYKDKIEIINL